MILKLSDINIDNINFSNIENINDISKIINIKYNKKPFFIFESPKMQIKRYNKLFNYLEVIVDNKHKSFINILNSIDGLSIKYLENNYSDVKDNYITSLHNRDDENIFKLYLTNKSTYFLSKNKEKIIDIDKYLKQSNYIKCVIQLKNIWINSEIQYGSLYELVDCIVIESKGN